MTILTALFLGTAIGYAQEVKLELPDTVCKVEQFIKRADSSPNKKCDRLKDAGQVKVKSMEGCKDRAVEKAGECLKLDPAAAQVSVKARFMEKFKNTSNSTTFTCEVDKLGGSACP